MKSQCSLDGWCKYRWGSWGQLTQDCPWCRCSPALLKANIHIFVIRKKTNFHLNSNSVTSSNYRGQRSKSEYLESNNLLYLCANSHLDNHVSLQNRNNQAHLEMYSVKMKYSHGLNILLRPLWVIGKGQNEMGTVTLLLFHIVPCREVLEHFWKDVTFCILQG